MVVSRRTAETEGLSPPRYRALPRTRARETGARRLDRRRALGEGCARGACAARPSTVREERARRACLCTSTTSLSPLRRQRAGLAGVASRCSRQPRLSARPLSLPCRPDSRLLMPPSRGATSEPHLLASVTARSSARLRLSSSSRRRGARVLRYSVIANSVANGNTLAVLSEGHKSRPRVRASRHGPSPTRAPSTC